MLKRSIVNRSSSAGISPRRYTWSNSRSRSATSLTLVGRPAGRRTTFSRPSIASSRAAAAPWACKRGTSLSAVTVGISPAATAAQNVATNEL